MWAWGPKQGTKNMKPGTSTSLFLTGLALLGVGIWQLAHIPGILILLGLAALIISIAGSEPQ